MEKGRKGRKVNKMKDEGQIRKIKNDNVDRGAAGHVQSAMPAGPFREP